MAGARLQVVVDELALQLGRGVTVDDASGRLMAYSAQGQDVDAARVQAILGRTSDAAVLAWESRFGSAGSRGPYEIPANPDLGMSSRRAVLLVHRGAVLGRVTVLSGDRPWTTEDDDLLARAGEQAAALLAAGLSDDPDQLLAQVVSARSQREARGPWSRLVPQAPALEEPGLVAVAVLGGGAEAGRRWPGRLVWTVVDGTLVVVTAAGAVTTTAGGGRHTEASGGPSGTRLPTGVGDPSVGGLAGVRRAVGQARVAAQLTRLDPALADRSGTGLLAWADAGVYRTLVGPGGLPTGSDPLARLESGADSEMGAQHTLEVWLDHGCDVRSTAAALHLHRSSLYHRLERVAHALGVDLSDGLTRLDLHVALKARRARGVRLPPGWGA
ncbi:PucR family transcriptional regulator [Ornithinimicrobium tianjinense]|uniref:Transcriptional regulator n=1 Tax=Ornithinimicrobium tianjinense TaxID=1195761 RepID=A0A917BKV3_9MICO|nr:helix-turn-helix domain-containing protein [Ornithinimicrobium tianjinense]GGF44406.1 transcriptional regulator [Ornithinimicrobium tianjinense]